MCRPTAEATPPSAAAALLEAEAVLEQLGYGRAEVKNMLEGLGDGARDCVTAEEVLALIYARRRAG